MSSTRRYEYKLAVQREADIKTANLSNYLADDKRLAENFRSDQRVVTKRMNADLRTAAREQFTTQQLEFSSAERAKQATMRQQDERLSAALASHKSEKFREEKNIQRVCEQSEELRELEAQLKAAYVNKERQVQIQESAYLAQQQDVREAEMARAMEEERQKGLQAEAYREYLRAQDGRQMVVELNQQMEEKEDRKRKAYDEFLKEKAMVDAVVQKILDEDAEERDARHAKEAETKKYIDDFVQQQEEEKAKRAAAIEAENEQIREYANKVMSRELELRLARERDQNTKDAILEGIAKQMAARQKEADEMEQLRNELIIQETEEAIIQKEKEKMARAVQQRLDVQLANEYQRQLKAIKREEEKKEEEAFRAAMMEKFAEDDRIDMLNAQRRREKQKEHRMEIERLLEERRKKFEEQRAMEMEEMLQAGHMAEIRRKIIEEERKRMLAAAALNLGLEHLPKGVLASEDDAKLFGKY